MNWTALTPCLEHHLLDDKPVFNYQLLEGVSEDGLGMYFIQRENLAEILEQANLNQHSLKK